jgi:nitroreductase
MPTSEALPPALAAFAELVAERRSVRGFHPDPLPQPLLDELFAIAQQAPSNCNTQPWLVHVASGAAIERLRNALHAAAAGGAEPRPDYPPRAAYPGVYRERQIEAAKLLFAARGIGRHDSEGRTRSALANFRFFEAPHVAFIFMPDWGGVREAVDCGIYAQTLMLALTAAGLASCAQGALGNYPEIVRSELGIAEDQRLLFGIAFGREDVAHATRPVRPPRGPLGSTTVFHS